MKLIIVIILIGLILGTTGCLKSYDESFKITSDCDTTCMNGLGIHMCSRYTYETNSTSCLCHYTGCSNFGG